MLMNVFWELITAMLLQPVPTPLDLSSVLVKPAIKAVGSVAISKFVPLDTMALLSTLVLVSYQKITSYI